MLAEISADLLERFLSCLHEVTGQHAQVLGQGSSALFIEVPIRGKIKHLLIEGRRVAYPRDVREAAWGLKEKIVYGPKNNETIPFIISEIISDTARKILRDEHIGYFDASGSLFLTGDDIFILIDKPRGKRQQRTIDNLFSGSRAQVLHTVWKQGQNWFSVQTIAEQAQVAPATASQTLTALEKRDWVKSRGAGPAKQRHLSNPRAMLDEWSSHQSAAKPKPFRHYFVSTRSAVELAGKLEAVCHEREVEYAITGEAAGQYYTPFLTDTSQLVCRLPADKITTVADRIGARPVRSGWNLGIIETDRNRELVFREPHDGVWLADPLLTYLDLLQMPGRARDLAQHLRREKLEDR